MFFTRENFLRVIFYAWKCYHRIFHALGKRQIPVSEFSVSKCRCSQLLTHSLGDLSFVVHRFPNGFFVCENFFTKFFHAVTKFSRRDKFFTHNSHGILKMLEWRFQSGLPRADALSRSQELLSDNFETPNEHSRIVYDLCSWFVLCKKKVMRAQTFRSSRSNIFRHWLSDRLVLHFCVPH